MYSYLKVLIFSCFICLLLSACTNYKNITYFRNISDSSDMYSKGKDLAVTDYRMLKIRPDDILKIIISTIDPLTDASLNLNSGQSDANTISSAQLMPGALNNSNTPNNGYRVSQEGNIDLPIVGSLHVAGMTMDQIKGLVKEKVGLFYKNPVINVSLINFKVTVLGEVLKPGMYVMEGEHATILDALGLAGDLTIYGKRDNVMMLRTQSDGEKKAVRFNLNNTSIFSSPYFYLKQGDVVYVEPNKGKAAANDLSRSRNYTIGAAILSLLVIIATRVNF